MGEWEGWKREAVHAVAMLVLWTCRECGRRRRWDRRGGGMRKVIVVLEVVASVFVGCPVWLSCAHEEGDWEGERAS